MFRELHLGSVETMDDHRRLIRRVHCHSADFPDLSQRQDIGHRVFVVPHLAEIGKISDHIRVLMAAVGEGPNHVVAATNVGEHRLVLEHRNGRLRVE